MTTFAWNLLLALVWVVLTATFSFANLLFGFAIAFVALRIAARGAGRPDNYFARIRSIFSFVLFFIYDLVKSNIIVAWDVVTPTHLMRPGVIAYPLELESSGGITLFANLISVTPGTLALDVSTDRKVLYIHVMYLDDEDAVRREIRALEQRVIAILN
ncbi:MAG: Na+/H+ antiporter subunit E [Pseudomonadota bacterium]